MRSSAGSWSATRGASWIPQATASSRRSTGLRARSAARLRSSARCGASAFRSGPACTPGSASSSATRWPVSPCTPERASPRWPGLERCSSPRRSRISWQVRESSSPSAARTFSRACRGSGTSTRGPGARRSVPDIRYAKNGGTSIAYQVVGDGPTDLVYVPDYVSNLVYAWESPHYRGFYERLARSFRLILFDKRGTGLSDSGREFATLETRMEDLHAVLDAAGSERAGVFGSHEGAAMATLYAATYPERTIALVAFQPSAHGGHWEGPEEMEEELRVLREQWGTQDWCDNLLRFGAPSIADSAEDREWFANWLRVGASPSVAYALNRAFFET